MNDTETKDTGKKIKTRFAPSPTGYLHIGGVRTALYAWLLARHHGGSFVLRIEDTDRERNTQEAVDVILDGMSWLGLGADEGPYYQTQRFDRYQEVVDQLLADGHAYACDCSRERLDELREKQQAAKQKPKYDGRCRHRTDVDRSKPHVIRFRNPEEGSVIFQDLVKGTVQVSNAELDDLIIVRSDGAPTYNLTVVVDDLDMEITHVVRGDDHLNNTPRQVNILKALGAPVPVYAHLPMIHGSDGKKLSKRRDPVSVTEYREQGYLPEALLNYLVRLGWSHGDQEIFSYDEMIKLFALEDVNKSASAMNPDKLAWLNQHYIQQRTVSELVELLQPHLAREGIDTSSGPDLASVVEVQRERARTLVELAELCGFFYKPITDYDNKAARKNLKTEVVEPFRELKEILSTGDWSQEAIHAAIQTVVDKHGLKFGKVAMPLRVALTGGAPSPGIDVTAYLIGREQVCIRIEQALDYIYNLES